MKRVMGFVFLLLLVIFVQVVVAEETFVGSELAREGYFNEFVIDVFIRGDDVSANQRCVELSGGSMLDYSTTLDYEEIKPCHRSNAACGFYYATFLGSSWKQDYIPYTFTNRVPIITSLTCGEACVPKTCDDLNLAGGICGTFEDTCTGTPLVCTGESVCPASTSTSSYYCLPEDTSQLFYDETVFPGACSDGSTESVCVQNVETMFESCPDTQVCSDPDGPQGPQDAVCVGSVPSENYWANMNGKPIDQAICAGSDVRLMTNGLGTADENHFFIYEDDDGDEGYSTGDDLITTVEQAYWTSDGSASALFESTTGVSNELDSSFASCDFTPLQVDIAFPRCGDFFVIDTDSTTDDTVVMPAYSMIVNDYLQGIVEEGKLDGSLDDDITIDDFMLPSNEANIRITMNNPYTYVEGTVFVDNEAYEISSLDSVYNAGKDVSEIIISHVFTSAGNVPIRVVLTDPQSQKSVSKTLNVMVVDSDSDTVDYAVASCIDHPKNNQQFETREVYFNGESTQGLKFTNGMLTVYSSDVLSYEWKFYHDNELLPEKCVGLGSEVCNNPGGTISDGTVSIDDDPVTKPVNQVISFVRSFSTVDKNSVSLSVSIPDDLL